MAAMRPLSCNILKEVHIVQIKEIVIQTIHNNENRDWIKAGHCQEISESNVAVKIRARSKTFHFLLNLADYYLDMDISGSFSAIFSK
jgi:hypothetical protein